MGYVGKLDLKLKVQTLRRQGLSYGAILSRVRIRIFIHNAKASFFLDEYAVFRVSMNA